MTKKDPQGLRKSKDKLAGEVIEVISLQSYAQRTGECVFGYRTGTDKTPYTRTAENSHVRTPDWYIGFLLYPVNNLRK